jgi:hypothetical protein
LWGIVDSEAEKRRKRPREWRRNRSPAFARSRTT